MAINRELSQFASFVEVDDISKNISIASSTTPYVGIGTTNPIAKFQVVGQTELDDVRISGIATISNAKIIGITSVGSGITLTSSGDAQYAGIITAYKFVGDGSGLTGTISGVGINSDGVTIGTGVTFINFAGPGVSTVTVSAGIATINFEGGGGGATIDKQTFNVGAGGTDLITLTNPYTTGYVDIFINGVKLSSGDYSELSSNTVGLTTAAVAGDTIDVVSFRSISLTNNSIGIQSGGVPIGNTFTTLNFIGIGNTFRNIGNGIVDISISGGKSSQWIENNTGIVTTSNVGIGTTTARYTLEVGSVGTSGTSLFVNGDITANSLRSSSLNNYSEKINNLGDTGSSCDINLADGNYVVGTLSTSTTFTFTTGISTGAIGFSLELKNGVGGPYTITWPVSVKWPNDLIPVRTTTDNKTDVWVFSSKDNGNTWYGNVALYNFS
jgi:hypothetical protein